MACIRVTHFFQGTVIEVDSGENKKMLFKCALHNQTETDSICFDPVLNIYKNVGPAMKSRLQAIYYFHEKLTFSITWTALK